MSVVEALFVPNRTLVDTVLQVMREQGHGLGERLFMAFKLRLAPRHKLQELERSVTGLLMQHVEAGLVTLPASAKVEDGVLVTDWIELFEWFLEHWEEILEIILAIISLF